MITHKNSESEVYMSAESESDAEFIKTLSAMLRDKDDIFVGESYGPEYSDATLRLIDEE